MSIFHIARTGTKGNLSIEVRESIDPKNQHDFTVRSKFEINLAKFCENLTELQELIRGADSTTIAAVETYIKTLTS